MVGKFMNKHINKLMLVIIIAVLIIQLVSCGGSSSSKDKGLDDMQEVYNRFLSLKLGTTLEEAQDLFGIPGSQSEIKEVDGAETFSQSFSFPSWDLITLVYRDDILIEKVKIAMSPETFDVNEEKYLLLKEGMTRAEVVQILGEGELTMSSIKYDYLHSSYSWVSNDFEDSIIGVFKDNILISASFYDSSEEIE